MYAEYSCVPRDLIQGHYRFRTLKDNEVDIFINNSVDNRKINEASLEGKLDDL